ncbi:response regulator transcription factor, partial [Lysobacter sp. 2RAB21]
MPAIAGAAGADYRRAESAQPSIRPSGAAAHGAFAEDPSDESPMRVLIADDHRLIVEGVKTKLSELEHEVEFVVAMNIAEFDAVLNRSDSPLDLAIIDISMPGAQGHRHIAEMRRVAADVPVIVLSGSEDTELIRTLLELGVQGFIPKAYSPDVMLSAVRLVLSGGVYVPPLLLAGVQARGWTPAAEMPAAARNLSAAAEQHSLDGLR